MVVSQLSVTVEVMEIPRDSVDRGPEEAEEAADWLCSDVKGLVIQKTSPGHLRLGLPCFAALSGQGQRM